MSPLRETLGRRFSRLTTNAVMRNPRLWGVFRGPMRRLFDDLAPRWQDMRSGDAMAPLEAGLDRLGRTPRRVLDLGTGTGLGAVAIAHRFPEAEVVGADVSPKMIEEARGNIPPELRDRLRFEVADASALPYDDEEFDLVAHANMFPFFDELDRVLAPGGHALFSFSGGPATPIYVPPDRLRAELEGRGFTDFADFSAGQGTGFLARKAGGA